MILTGTVANEKFYFLCCFNCSGSCVLWFNKI